MGVPFAFVLGIVAGLTELAPAIGPWIGGAAGVLVTMATKPAMVLWVILLYLGVQIEENVLLVPRIHGDALNLHPVEIIRAIVIASNYFGLWGVILGPPVVALIRSPAVHFAKEWNRPPGPMEPAGRREPEVATPEQENGYDAVCSSTGRQRRTCFDHIRRRHALRLPGAANLQGQRNPIEPASHAPVTPAKAGVRKIPDGYQPAYSETLLDSSRWKTGPAPE